jgi:cysteine desulfurase
MPQAGRPIYLDHQATTPVDPRVLDAMLPYFGDKFGNASSVNHAFGWEAADAVEKARQEIGLLLQADPRSLIFTSGATEANNLALKGVVQAAPPQSHVIATAAEHRSVLDPLRRLERLGTELTILNVDSYGRVGPDDVARAIRPNTLIVSVIWANNEVGSLNPIREIGAVCRERGVLFHTDAVQAVGKLPIDLSDLGIDLLSASAHKLYGPKGVGILFIRRDSNRIHIEPLVYGGGHEQRLRSGTLPVPLIVGFGEACRIAAQELAEESRRLLELRERLWAGLRREMDGLVLNGHPSERLAGNLNVSFEGVDGEALMMGLSGIAVSSGSACTSADPEPSHVLRAMGRNESLTRASLRFGLGRSTTVAEIDEAISTVAGTVRRLRTAEATRTNRDQVR